MEKIVPLLIVMAFLLIMATLLVLLMRWARRSSRRGAFLAWGVQLMGAGMSSTASAGTARRSKSAGENQKVVRVGRP